MKLQVWLRDDIWLDHSVNVRGIAWALSYFRQKSARGERVRLIGISGKVLRSA